jgi:hypothetical protein
LPVADRGLPVAGCRLPSGVSRVAGCRLPSGMSGVAGLPTRASGVAE